MPKPWRHQRDVLSDLVIGHFLLLWEMGTGKTAALILAGAAVGGRGLWLSPAVLLEQAAAEIRRWRPGATVQIIRNGRERVRDDVDLVLCSYDLMRRLPIWRQLYAMRWDSCVCDEGHALAHSTSMRTQAFYGARDDSRGALFRRCDRVWVATGTPIMNSPDELHPHLSRLFPHLIPDLTRKQDFLGRFCVLVRKTFGDVVVGGRNLRELGEILRACSSRVKLDDVTDLPPLIADTISVTIDKKDREAIEASIPDTMRRDLHVVLTQIEGGIDAAWQRLNAMLLPLASTRRLMALAKAEAAARLVMQELNGGADRIVLFGLHIDALKYIAGMCESQTPLLMIGDTPLQTRQSQIDAFTAGTSRLLIASVKLAGFGLNLQAARRCIFLETEWTPAAYDQAVARLYRAGQSRSVHASILTVSNSIDARGAEVLRRKRVVVQEIMGDAA